MVQFLPLFGYGFLASVHFNGNLFAIPNASLGVDRPASSHRAHYTSSNRHIQRTVLHGKAYPARHHNGETVMKKSIATKWVKALRSGKYEQGSGTLHEGNEFCCMGVLCEIYPDADWEREEDESFSRFLSKSAELPPDVMDWAGIENNEGAYGGGRNLIAMNDGRRGRGMSFKQIANIIECNWKKL